MKTYMITLAVILALSAPTYAQGIPVYDAAGFAQFATQLQNMKEDYQKQLEQLDEAVKQSSALTGTRGMGDLANGYLEQELRQYLPNTWQETMHMINAQNLSPSTSGAQSIYSTLNETYEPLAGSDFVESDPNGAISQAFDRRTGTTYAALAASEQAYNNIGARIQNYEAMLSELNNTPDLKASTDLQARISAENGLIMNELIRLQAIQMQQNASIDNQKLTGFRRANTANQYDPAQAREAMRLDR